MPYAVTLRLDENAAGQVRRLRVDTAIDYAPHLTLAVYPDDSDIKDTVATLVAEGHAMPVAFAALGLFPGEGSVLWVAPVATEELLRRHATLLGALPAAHPHYRPGAWVPHVTLAQHVPARRVATAVADLAAAWQPFSGSFD